MKTENELIQLAEMHLDNDISKAAMKELRERFDNTYMWCSDCDGLVVKTKDCCFNKNDVTDTDVVNT